MSRVCIFNIEDNIKDFKRLNYIAKEIVKISLENDIGVSFNSNYCEDLWREPIIKNYFVVSDSFLYRQSDELLSTNYFWEDGSINSYKKKFIERFSFFNILLNKLFSLGLENIEILFSDVNLIDELKNFETIQTNKLIFLNDLLNVTLQSIDEFGGQIPNSLRFKIVK